MRQFLELTGVQSDADRVAEFRAFMRMRRTMRDQFGSYMMRNFTRFMVKVSILYICMQGTCEERYRQCQQCTHGTWHDLICSASAS